MVMALRSIKAAPLHVAQAWAVLQSARDAMRKAGRSQWQGCYPAQADVERDIANGVGRVLLSDHDGVVGYCALVTTGDPCYAHITGGQWLTSDDSRYAVIHRMAIHSDSAGHGLATQWIPLLLHEARQLGCVSVRVDTNHDNVQMLRLLPAAGFTRCGNVRQSDGDRIAFERLL